MSAAPSGGREGPPSRILMTADTVGGVWTYALELAARLSGRGVQTILATMGRPPSPEQRREARAIGGLVLESGDFALEWMPGAERDFEAAGKWLLGLTRAYRPNLVHLNGYAHAAMPWPAPCIVVAHSCVVSWWRAVWGEPPPPEWTPYRTRTARGLAVADVVVSPSAAFLHELRAIYGPLPHARVIHNGRAEGVARTKEPFVFAAGRIWDEAKNISVLDMVAPSAAWPIYAAGDTLRPDGRRAALNHVECLGVLEPEEVADRMARAAIFVSPAKYEPFGLAVLEAALAGCALVLSDIPTFREIWNGAAVFVKADSPAPLQSALSALIDDPGRCRALGEAARQRARSYSPDRMVQSYSALYSELCSQPCGALANAG